MKARNQLLFVIAWVFSMSLYGQTGKHHRVVELENFLKQKVEKTFVSRFPELPYLINVSIIPIRNLNRDRYALDEDGLPYFEIEQNYIDQWDDPKVSKYQLLNLVKTIKLNVLLPDSIQEKDISDLKESIYNNLNLVAGRDDVSIKRKNWSAKPIPVNNYLFALGLLFASLIGLWMIFRFSLGTNLAKTIEASGNKKTDDGSSPMRASAPMASVSPSSGGSGSGLASETLSLRLTDTLKVKSFVLAMVEEISKNESFPALKDMLELESLGKKNEGQLGALLMCFPVQSRRKIFSYSHGSYWMEALYHPTEIGPESLGVLEKIERNLSEGTNLLWEELLIRSWKMDELLPQFLQKMDKKDAFCILNSLPQNISIPVARDSFPGAWGTLLDSETEYDVMSESDIKRLISLAKEIDDDREETAFDGFRKDKELQKFLRAASVQQEREVYATLPKSSLVTEIRPPFYPVLDADPIEIAELMGLFGIEEWAAALFNVSREERKHIEGFFAPKELKVYRSFLMSYDVNRPNADDVGIKRENIARKLYDIQQSVGQQELANEDLSAA